MDADVLVNGLADVLVNGLADVVVTAPPRRRRLC